MYFVLSHTYSKVLTQTVQWTNYRACWVTSPKAQAMTHNDLEAQRSIVLSFRIQELHQLLTYGGMSKSGNKPTLQVLNFMFTSQTQPFVLWRPVCSETGARIGWVIKRPEHVDQNTRAVKTGIVCFLSYTCGILSRFPILLARPKIGAACLLSQNW